MIREKAKELWPILKAYAEGKEVQYFHNIEKKWRGVEEPNFESGSDWRVKPEPTYRAFNSQEECWAEMQKHQPFGWLKSKYDGSLFFIDSIEGNRGHHGSSSFLFEEPFLQATFADGTPFGVKVEADNQ